jgi:O-antigen/teichoic acid export membrane protein
MPLHSKKRVLLDLLLKAVNVLLLRVGGSALSFVFSILVAQMLGAEGAGLYFLAFSVMMFTSVMARLGFDGTILRFVAHNAALEEWGKVQGAFRRIILITGLTTSLVGVLLFIGGGFLARELFGKPDLEAPLRLMGLAVIPLSQMRLVGQALKGLNKVAISEAVASLVQPLIGLILLYPFILLLGVEGAALAFLLSSLGAALLGHIYWWRNRKRWDAVSETPDNRQLASSAVPLWLSSTVNQAILPWAPVALLGLWASTADVGVFGAAARLANLIAVFLVGINSVLAPQFSKMQATNRSQEIGALSRQFSLIVTLGCLPIFLILIFAGDWVMGLFGDQFREGGSILAVLVIGQLAATLCGSVRMVLIMTGREKDLRNSSFLSLLVLIGVAVALIPIYGALGAAIASTAGTIVTNALPVFVIWKKMGIMTVPGLNLIFRDRPPPS